MDTIYELFHRRKNFSYYILGFLSHPEHLEVPGTWYKINTTSQPSTAFLNQGRTSNKRSEMTTQHKIGVGGCSY